MNLHRDEYAFGSLINDIHEKSNIRSDIIEKDYYVMLLLYELSKKLYYLHILKVGLPCIRH